MQNKKTLIEPSVSVFLYILQCLSDAKTHL